MIFYYPGVVMSVLVIDGHLNLLIHLPCQLLVFRFMQFLLCYSVVVCSVVMLVGSFVFGY